ncbi:hypothetical protein GH714_006861 [Hevea brasiliensis]|uniref:Uncharacterized protein n=1 Tax=Hevea brasiliensis TaxID=3981 RepID=A0A6A6K3S3_HEVBR|nr:hypothetical protein GH714_006861 [Hevea brasiliensis]
MAMRALSEAAWRPVVLLVPVVVTVGPTAADTEEIVGLKTDIGSEGVVSGLEPNNKIAVGPHSEVVLGLVGAQGQSVVAAPPGGAKQGPTVGYVFQVCCQFSWVQMQVVKLFPQIGNGLVKRTPSAQDEA